MEKYIEEIRGALARGYCSKENENKELDSVLLEAMVPEIEKLCAEVDRRAREEGRKFELLVLEEHLKKQIYQSSISTDSVYRYIDERIADLNNQ